MFVNGIGGVCPPMVIHKGQRVQQYWSEGSKPGVTLAVTPKGHITKHKFHLNLHWSCLLVWVTILFSLQAQALLQAFQLVTLSVL